MLPIIYFPYISKYSNGILFILNACDCIYVYVYIIYEHKLKQKVKCNILQINYKVVIFSLWISFLLPQ